MGNGGTSTKNTPTLTSSLGTGRTAVALSSGEYHTCAILDNGRVSCWGKGNDGRLGNGGGSNAPDKNTPTLTNSLGSGRTAVAIASGYYHTCALLDNGLVSCWGLGLDGQLGNGEHGTKPLPRSPQPRVAQPLRSLPEMNTPAPSSTMLMFRAGDLGISADWVMEEHLKKTRQLSQAVLVLAAQRPYLNVTSTEMAL